jgi:hypothetical protein
MRKLTICAVIARIFEGSSERNSVNCCLPQHEIAVIALAINVGAAATGTPRQSTAKQLKNLG